MPCSPRPRSSTPTRRRCTGPGGPAGTSRRRTRCGTREASTSPARPPTPASSPTRTSASPTSSSPTAHDSTSTTHTPNTAPPKSPTPWTPSCGTRPANASWPRPAERAAQLPGAQPIHLYKNNTDNKGASYGTHENYLMKRETPFSDIVRHLTPFFVSRQVVTGAGRVGVGQDGHEHGFQLSQRADYFEVEVGLETTLKRPIINTRDEPHADAEKYRRLHVIIGDANMSEISTFLKLGSAALVLDMIEANFLADDLAISAPVRELHTVSHDPSLQHAITLADGRTITALDLQGE